MLVEDGNGESEFAALICRSVVIEKVVNFAHARSLPFKINGF